MASSHAPSAFEGWMTPRSLLRWSIVVAIITIVLKMWAWQATGSVGLLSDALEAFVNLAGAIFALAMVTVAQRPADADHPYGHHKAEYFSAGFEGLLVIGASVAIIWISVARWLEPQPLEQLDWGLGLAVLSALFNGGLAWLMFRGARRYRSMALEGDARHLMADVYTTAGVVVGLILAKLTGWWWLDPAVGVAVGLNILWHGADMLWRASQGLMDMALDDEHLQQVDAVLHAQVQAAQAQTGVLLVFDNLTSRQAGERSFIDVHLHVPGHWSMAQAAYWRHQTEAALMHAIPGLQARIELLPEGTDTAFERQSSHAAASDQPPH